MSNLLLPGRFDDLAGLQTNIRCLDSFNEILGLRHQARNEANANNGRAGLDEWVIMGRWLLDTFGQFARINAIEDDDYNIVDVKDLLGVVPVVMHKDDFRKLLQLKKCGFRWGFPSHIPGKGMVCAQCKKPFTLETAYHIQTKDSRETIDLSKFAGLSIDEAFNRINTSRSVAMYMDREHPLRNDRYIDLRPLEGYETLKINQGGLMSTNENEDRYKPIDRDAYRIQVGDEMLVNTWQYFHDDCWKDHLADVIHDEFTQAIVSADMNIKYAWTLPNEYGSANYNGPWMEFEVVNVHEGTCAIIKVGWRKRVIELDYNHFMTDDDDLSHLFADEDVTKGTGTIHCWGYDKLTEYLKRIGDHLREKKK